MAADAQEQTAERLKVEDAADRRIIWLYNAFQLFFNLLLWIPIFYEFQKQLGLDDPQIFRIQSVYYLVFCFFEIPTGAFADLFGYKQSLIWGGLILAIANILPMALPSYVGMMSHFLAIALARSLISGASSAWLYEWLKSRGIATHYKTIEGNARFYSLIAKVACWAVVGYLMAASIFLPYWLSALNALIALAIAFTLPDVRPTEVVQVVKAKSLDGLRLAAHALRSSPLILVYMAQGIGIFVMIRILQVNLYQPVLSSKGFAVASYGLIMSLMTVFEALGSRATPFLRSRLRLATIVGTASLLLSVCLVSIAWGNQVITLISFCIFSLAAGLVFPVQKQLLNDAIRDSRVRATLLSTESILDRAVCAVAVLPLGDLVLKGALKEILLVSAVVTAVVIYGVHLVIDLLEKRQPMDMLSDAQVTKAKEGAASAVNSIPPKGDQS